MALLDTAHGSREEAQAHTLMLLSVGLLLILAMALFTFLSQQETGTAGRSLEELKEGEEVEVKRPCTFDEDIYMMAVALLANDSHTLAKGTSHLGLPIARMLYAVVLFGVTVFIQIGLVVCTKLYVTPQQVASIRDSYDAFEIHMYSENTRVLPETGKHRGLAGHYDVSNFDSFDRKGEVCQIPFSQMKFLVLILLVWTITCVAQISRCMTLGHNLLIALPTISSMADAIELGKNNIRRRKTLVGLTMLAKFVMIVAVFLPWLLTTCFLLYLGCRWLAATNDFSNLLCNGMALEFILQFKSLMYYAVTTERTKRDVGLIMITPPAKYESASVCAYYNAVLWGVVSVIWVYLYIFHLQSVLPEYQWDVHEPCSSYLAAQRR
jgi:hypothetical protein